jgi:uncharacterized protein (TIGR03437 family)
VATLQSIAPSFFAAGGYVAAIRSDGTIINGSGAAVVGYATTAAAKPGDTLELFGTGFGPVSPSVAPGVVYSGSAPLSNAVVVTVGGVAATVSYAGLVGAGLYQINILVPALSDGDAAIVAQISALTTQPGVFLKIKN